MASKLEKYNHMEITMIMGESDGKEPLCVDLENNFMTEENNVVGVSENGGVFILLRHKLVFKIHT